MRRTFAAAVVVLGSMNGPAQAQSATFNSTAAVAAGVGGTWDDEGQIGSGGLLGVRIDRRLFGHTFVEASVAALGHERTGRFSADGRTLLLTGALVQRFGRSPTQPYILGGVLLAHHRGTFGFPEDQLTNQTESTGPGVVFGGGVAFPIGTRFEAGPETRFLTISSGSDSGPAFAYWIGVRLGLRF